MEPLLVGVSDAGGNVYDVVVQGIFANIADTDMEDPGVRIVDISDPSSPTETGFLSAPGYVEAVAVVGDYAYVARV